ncbi:MAG: branched-chain amino acid ABC transporter permease [Ornithinibacter sp.]
MSRLRFSDETRVEHGPKAPLLALAGGALMVISGLLSWSFDNRVLDDISIRFYPAGIQIYSMMFGVLALILGVLLIRRPPWMSPARGLRILGITALVFLVWVLGSIAIKTGGLINLNEGGWVALVGAVLITVAGHLSPDVDINVLTWPRLSSTLEILIIIVLMAVLLFTVAYTLNIQDGVVFASFLVALVGMVGGLLGTGFGGYLGFLAANNRRPLLLAAFVVAFLFPFTQNGSDANMSIATQILIFAATALGLNIVVGLAGLLDLGYIAFLGTGAYVGAMLSNSAFSTVGWHPPFVIVMLVGAGTAATFGLIIGTPTLRVSGDYLAIVTLGFGEIFRLAMFNLDGNNGPDLTNGPNGIPAIPDLNLLGFDFGVEHTIAGIPLGRFSNYYFLLLLLLMFVILVFTRLNDSRIGRGWVAIREDERAAEAMGVNVFGLKLLAFAVGAFLAGLAGTIKAHQDTSVSPDQYVFLESAFLLAAVVLGGMGTVMGVLVGATILKLLPEKLREVSEYRLLMFGLLLVVMMRFRPEGLVPSKRRQLEFHEEDTELVELVQAEHLQEAK